MTPRAASRLAWSLWAFGLALLMAGMLISLFIGPARWGIVDVIWIAGVVGFGTIGALIGSRHLGNPVGWVMLSMAIFAGLSGGLNSYATARPRLPGYAWAAWLDTSLGLMGVIGGLVFVILLFPDGRLLSPRWRVLVGIHVLALVTLAVGMALTPGVLEEYPGTLNPVGVQAVRGTPLDRGGVGWGLLLVSMPGAAASMIVRLRRARGDQREQLKWLAWSVGFVALTWIGMSATFELGPAVQRIGIGVFSVALLTFPIAVGVAILKYRLYAIDVFISKAVVYGLLAAFITVVYVGIVVGVGTVVGSRGNLFLSIVATALIAVAFQPLRQRARHLANRLVYGKRASPYEVLAEFSGRMADTVATEEVLPRIARILGEGTGAGRAEVWLRVGDSIRPAAAWPEEVGARRPVPLVDGSLTPIEGVDRAAPVSYQGELLGALAVRKPPGEALSAAEDKLLTDLASQAGLVLRNVRLTEELRASLDQLRASRQRIVAAQDHERRRLERNIHDGAQQELVALAVQLRLAEQIATKKAPDMAELLARIKAATQEALDNLRDLARGIYPPLLADRGLAAALEAQARKSAVLVEVETDSIGRYPEEAEAAAYFCVLEALQNVAKYANAARAVVRLAEEDGQLTFSVSDDGVGFDQQRASRGSGLQNMSDRVEALGGTLELESAPGRGTTVTGRIPVPSARAEQPHADQQGPQGDEGPQRQVHDEEDRLQAEDPAR